MELLEGKINIMLDGQFGSTGKGLLAAYVASINHIDIAITNSSANAGHTFYHSGTKHIVKHLPVSGIINDRSTIYLCAGSIINPKVLLEEMYIHNVSTDRVFIHPRCAIISPEDIYLESMMDSVATKLSSTQSGVGSALARKINRSAGLAKDNPILKHMVRDVDVQGLLDTGCTAFMEVPQGFDLSISSGLAYPYCTSREITVSAALADAQMHPHYLGKIMVALRTFPIRVGNIMNIDGEEIGYSGPFYPDSTETSWDALGVIPERTTVTNRVRRVATFSILQYIRMLKCFLPDYVFLNFANYMSTGDLNKLLQNLPEVTHLGYGPTIEDVHKV